MVYAQAHPDRQVVLKPRHRIGEDTFHRMRFHPEVLLSGVRKPANFSIDYTPISERLTNLDLMVTISSTAALEAVGAGVRTAFVADLDVREQLGNHIFLAPVCCGPLTSWSGTTSACQRRLGSMTISSIPRASRPWSR
jgi:hypothetical protein